MSFYLGFPRTNKTKGCRHFSVTWELVLDGDSESWESFDRHSFCSSTGLTEWQVWCPMPANLLPLLYQQVVGLLSSGGWNPLFIPGCVIETSGWQTADRTGWVRNMIVLIYSTRDVGEWNITPTLIWPAVYKLLALVKRWSVRVETGFIAITHHTHHLSPVGVIPSASECGFLPHDLCLKTVHRVSQEFNQMTNAKRSAHDRSPCSSACVSRVPSPRYNPHVPIYRTTLPLQAASAQCTTFFLSRSTHAPTPPPPPPFSPPWDGRRALLRSALWACITSTAE